MLTFIWCGAGHFGGKGGQVFWGLGFFGRGGVGKAAIEYLNINSCTAKKNVMHISV